MFWFKKHQWQEHRFKDGGKSVSSPPAGPCVPESTQNQVMTTNHKLLANKKSGGGLRSTGMDAVWTPSFSLLKSWYAPGPFPGSLASNLGIGRKLKGRKTAVSLSRPGQTRRPQRPKVSGDSEAWQGHTQSTISPQAQLREHGKSH